LGFSLEEIIQLIRAGLEIDEYYLADYLKNNESISFLKIENEIDLLRVKYSEA
jgi:hypothetical protein